MIDEVPAQQTTAPPVAGQTAPPNVTGPLCTGPAVTVTVSMITSALTALYILTEQGLALASATAFSLIPAVVICTLVLPAPTGATLRRRALAAPLELPGGVNQAP
ncbi:hypothetical protein ACWIGW_44070 [Nocardia brasiliensis]|uniref:hypothetical protein n=1 Tax=Streptomyces sp. NPDC056056 TaxID=3345698 RepID=UPI0035DD4D58